MTGLAITNREWVYTVDPEVWGPKLHDLAAVSAWHMGLHDIAKEQARIAAEMGPDDPRLQANWAFFQTANQNTAA